MSKKIIDRFTQQEGYEFLSNFHSSTLSYEGKLYPTAEHAYQASKSKDEVVRETIRRSKNPAEAKKLGHCILPYEGWHDQKIDIMRKIIKEKFENPFLRHLLLKTDDAELILNNKWNDRFWGVCRGIGENWLGKILMEERQSIKEELEAEQNT